MGAFCACRAGRVLRREDLEVELLVDVGQLVLGGHGEELVGHGGEDSEVAGGMLSECGDDLVGEEVGIACLGEGVLEPVGECLGRRGCWA